MAPRRRMKPDGDGVGESTVEFANPSDDTTADFAKPVYLVAAREVEQKAQYSVLKIDAGAGAGDVRTVAELPCDERGILRASTIIFDPSTLKTFHGPRLGYPKHKPVLISQGTEVYAISGRPKVKPYMDCEPWFECLSFKDGIPSKECGRWVPWRHLPPPPFFPCFVDPHEFRHPPEISISSYAAVGSYIVLSPQPALVVGTYAFHVVNKTWDKVHDKNLPFLGQAVPLGESLFAACPISNNSIAASTSASVFHMSINFSAVSTPSLSIQEFKVVTSEDNVPWPLFCPMGKGSFCCIRLGRSLLDLIRWIHLNLIIELQTHTKIQIISQGDECSYTGMSGKVTG
uniref:DUF1618 domain-containing protein n=1 Tax=Leersia perrieri TaxID=77586 RepID=A0A0D9XNZ5_9ORYZ